MKSTGKCPKCGSTDILTKTSLVTCRRPARGVSWTELHIGREENPAALIFKGLVETPVSAWVCAGCGFMELYADKPEMVKKAAGETVV